MNTSKLPVKAEDFIIASIDKAYMLFSRKLDFCIERYSEPGIHDLRVSIRRMLSLLILLGSFTDVPYVVDLQKSLKKILKYLNPLRDTQVEVSLLKNLVFKFPVLYTFYIHTLNTEMAFAENAGVKIKNTDRDNIEGLVFFLKLYLKQRYTLLGFKTEKMSIIRNNAFNELTGLYSAANKGNTDSIHKVRLALKKYRYLEEALKPVFSLPKERFKAMKELQDTLGDIQDYTVFITRLNNFILSQRVIPADKFVEVLKYLGKTRNSYIAKVFAMREEFLEQFIKD